MFDDAPFNWHRGSRSSHNLGNETGVYALFLAERAHLPGITPQNHGLIYVGKAGGAGGFLKRCHFLGSTRNHSPRKSLAVLLLDELHLCPIRIDKPNNPHTWSLDRTSEKRLTDWMLVNLLLAIEPGERPDARETEIVRRLAPALNLAKCFQTEQRQRISAARKRVWSTVASNDVNPARRTARGGDRESLLAVSPSEPMETAEAMAARYGLLAKSFRSALRRQIAWYRKPQSWKFPVGSDHHRDMEIVAQGMRI